MNKIECNVERTLTKIAMIFLLNPQANPGLLGFIRRTRQEVKTSLQVIAFSNELRNITFGTGILET